MDVQNDDYDTIPDKRSGEDTVGVDSGIFSELRRLGIENERSRFVLPDQDINKLSSGLLIECHFRRGKRFPMLIRHFMVKSTFVTWINIKLIDLSTKETLGEVEYNRSPSKEISYVTRKMFEKMLYINSDTIRGITKSPN